MNILIKSNTGGYSEYDDCDFLVKKLRMINFQFPELKKQSKFEKIMKENR